MLLELRRPALALPVHLPLQPLGKATHTILSALGPISSCRVSTCTTLPRMSTRGMYDLSSSAMLLFLEGSWTSWNATSRGWSESRLMMSCSRGLPIWQSKLYKEEHPHCQWLFLPQLLHWKKQEHWRRWVVLLISRWKYASAWYKSIDGVMTGTTAYYTSSRSGFDSQSVLF